MDTTGKIIDGDIQAHTVSCCPLFDYMLSIICKVVDTLRSINALRTSLLSSMKQEQPLTRSSKLMCFWLTWMTLQR